MIVVVLSVVLAAVAGGCVCVVWASRGGPRWVRAVSFATLTAGELVRRAPRVRAPRVRATRGGGDDG
ncbi:hypothetical protein GCM10010145_44720 [Streptomyces ruber]|uniref:Uncharacterized protein n=2 Tax=Streptomyces TaxID=1883 RepID=A0A918EUI4_9ACTN|nr:hypothetical protein [Streptomyces ruber]GGQ69988.1 hypothetical protein GCM10010145_44720 [Streptomyces ruber]